MHSIDIHTLFVQLQTRYPLSSIVTDLVQVHKGLFVVKAAVQLGGTTIASGLAAAATVELAEDQARVRALNVLGIASGFTIPQPQPLSSVNISSTGMGSTGNGFTSLPSLDKDSWLDNISTLTQDDRSIDSASMDVDTSGSNFGASTSSTSSISAPTINDLTISGIAPPLEAFHPDSTQFETAELAADVFEPMLEEPFESDGFGSDGFDDKSEAGETEGMFESGGSDLVEPDAVELAARVEPDRDLAASTSATSTPPKPQRSSKAEPAIAPAADEPNDLSTLIAHTDVEMDRIGWGKQEGRDYLKQTYGKSTRQRLDVDELMDFLNYLRALPSVNGL